MDSLCCELGGVIPEKICCLEAHGAIHREFLPGGAKCLFYGISHHKKNSKGTRQLTAGLIAHTTNPPLGGLSRGVRRELGVVLACLVVVPVRAW